MSRYIRKNLNNRHIEEPTVNLTPLIDVVFVILIMFILVAPLLELDRVELAEASAKTNDTSLEARETSPISIHVQSDNAILFNNRKVKAPELTALLIQAKKNHPKARPQLFHDKRAQFGTYQSVKNAAEEAGFEQMDIILRPG